MTTRRKHGIHQKFWSGNDTQAMLSDAAAWAEREPVLIHHFFLSRSKHGFVRAHAYYQTLEDASNTEIPEGIAIGMGATIHTGPAARVPATVIETTSTGKTLTLQRDRVVRSENGELTFAPDPEGIIYRARSFRYETDGDDTGDDAEKDYVEWRVLRMGYHVDLGVRYSQEE